MNDHNDQNDFLDFLPPSGGVVRFDADDGVDDHTRSCTVVIPDVPADIYDISYLTVPIRLLLKLVADANPSDADRLLALRDAYYGGDDEEDYALYATENINRTMTHEERARAKVARAAGFDAREAKRLILEAEDDLREPESEPLAYENWHPFSAERAELAAEFNALKRREEAHALEWEKYAADNGVTFATDYVRWAKWYSGLMDEADGIEIAHHEYAKRYKRLSDKVSAEDKNKSEASQ